MIPKSLIDCDDYSVGDFKPVAFTPKLKWKITESEFVEHPTTKLPRSIKIEAECFGGIFTVASYPYIRGLFNIEHRCLGIKTRRFKTNDPEEAVFLAESWLKKWAKNLTIFYSDIANSL